MKMIVLMAFLTSMGASASSWIYCEQTMRVTETNTQICDDCRSGREKQYFIDRCREDGGHPGGYADKELCNFENSYEVTLTASAERASDAKREIAENARSYNRCGFRRGCLESSNDSQYNFLGPAVCR